MKKLRSLLLVLTVSVVLAACAGGSTPPATDSGPSSAASPSAEASVSTSPNAEASASTTTANTDAVPITVFAQQGATWNLETNWFSQQAEDMFNIDFTWQTTTWDPTAAREARQIQLASGDYPDLYLLIPWVDQFSQAELIRYGQQGVILPLNDLLAQHAPNIQRVFEEYPWFRAHVTAPDGNIYGMTQLIECYHCQHAIQAYINQAWLDKLGLEMPTTTEEFEAVLQAFKTQDPNGNGQADEVPLTGNVQFVSQNAQSFLLYPFLYFGQTDVNKVPLNLNGDRVESAANKEEFREAIAYVADLYAQGLIDPGAFSQNLEAMQQLGNNASATLVGVFPAAPRGSMPGNEERLREYAALPPLTGPDGEATAFYGSSTAPGATFVLTNQASPEAQVAAIKMLDSMFTNEGQLVSYWGEEGVDWRRPKPGETAVNPELEPLFAEIPVETGTAHNGWQPLGQYYQPRDWRDRWVVGEDIYDPANYARWLQESTDLYAPAVPEDQVFPFNSLWLDPTLADEAATLQTNIGDYVQQNMFQFITGGQDLESGWDQYVAGLEQLGLPRYLEIMQQGYDTYRTNAE